MCPPSPPNPQIAPPGPPHHHHHSESPHLDPPPPHRPSQSPPPPAPPRPPPHHSPFALPEPPSNAPPPPPPPPAEGASGQQLVGGVVGVQNRGVTPPWWGAFCNSGSGPAISLAISNQAYSCGVHNGKIRCASEVTQPLVTVQHRTVITIEGDMGICTFHSRLARAAATSRLSQLSPGRPSL